MRGPDRISVSSGRGGPGYLSLVLLQTGAHTPGVIGKVQSDRHASLSVYNKGQGLYIEVVLQLPLGVLQHLHCGLRFRQLGVEPGEVDL